MRLLERWRAWRAMRGYRELTPSSPEGSHVRVSGVVRVLDETVIAPLSGLECVMSRSRIVANGYTKPPPTPAIIALTRPFVLEAQGAKIVVDSGAVVFGIDAVRLGPPDDDRKMAFAARFAVSPAAYAKFEEIVIRAGRRITVGGVLLHDLNPEPPRHERIFRERAAPRLRLVGSDQHPLVIVAGR